MRSIFTLRRAAAVTAIAAAAVSSQAFAATTTATLGSSATVTSNCTVSTTAVSFGDVNVISGSNVDATGGISVTCTSGTAWTASADAGLGTGATLDTRKMSDGTNFLDYVLYTDSSRTSIWGDGVGGTTSTVADTGSGTAQPKTIYARVPSGQTSLPAGAYSDTVTVTVTY
jgi:spore coat protein U-like protein